MLPALDDLTGTMSPLVSAHFSIRWHVAVPRGSGDSATDAGPRQRFRQPPRGTLVAAVEWQGAEREGRAVDLSAEHLHRQLDLVAIQGWEGPAAAELLQGLRHHVVRPVVRASRLRGPAAEQAEATGWAAAWDALRRPTARTAENPAGMVWTAVRRSIAGEARAGTLAGLPVGDLLDLEGARPFATPDPGSGHRHVHGAPELGPLDVVVKLLCEVGWDASLLDEVVGLVAEAGCTGGWRLAAARCGVPAWQVRRVARLIAPSGAPPSLLALVVHHGPATVEHPAARWAARSTRTRRQGGPEPSLEVLAAALGADGSACPARRSIGADQQRSDDGASGGSAQRVGILP